MEHDLTRSEKRSTGISPSDPCQGGTKAANVSSQCVLPTPGAGKGERWDAGRPPQQCPKDSKGAGRSRERSESISGSVWGRLQAALQEQGSSRNHSSCSRSAPSSHPCREEQIQQGKPP